MSLQEQNVSQAGSKLTATGLAIQANGVRAAYGDHVILDGVDLSIRWGEVACLVGPSGAGKTTLLRCLAGLMPAAQGEVRVSGHAITSPSADIALVFQDYRGSLLPWMRVLDNVAFPLQGKGISKTQRERKALECLERVGLVDVSGKYPWQLSGGMQQRVAIARALAYESPVMLMDEPFGSLDAQTRYDLEELVLQLRKELGITIVVVTHDIDEAIFLGDRVVVFGGSPATIVESIDVPLGSDRDQITTKSLPEFSELRARVLVEVKELALTTGQAARNG